MVAAKYSSGCAELPEDAPFIEQMKRWLQTSEVRAAYGQRKSTIEPVFGIKEAMGFRRFSLREQLYFVWNSRLATSA